MTESPAAPTLRARTAYHHGDLRAQLIAAVRELVESDGPDGFSVAEAARRAGVSSAAPYKHFRDRAEILRGVVGEAMDRLRTAMETGAATYPAGSVEAVAAVGLAYISFARTEPGVFRLAFGLTEGHENDPDLQAKGERTFDVVVRCAAACLGLPPEDDQVQACAYMLWCFVHGLSFLTIDNKRSTASTRIDDWTYLLTAARAILGQPIRG